MKKREFLVAWAVVLVLFLGCVILLVVSRNFKQTSEINYDVNGLPVLEINLEGVTLEEINAGSKEVKYEKNQAVFYDDTEIENFDDVTVKGRGNTTWAQLKKPYQIDLGEKTDLLELGKRSKWILMANYLDTSYLRNDTAFYLARMVGEDFALDGEPIELMMDGEDLGLYYLVPKVEIGKNSVDLRSDLGIIVELDNLHTDYIEQCYLSSEGNRLIINDVVDKSNEEMAMSNFMQSYNELEVAAIEGNFEKVKSLIDVESFVQYFLVSEFTNNPDAYATSHYMYKDGVDDKIHAGPVWDFDFAFGNARWSTDWTGYSPESDLARRMEAFGGTYCDENQCVEIAEDKGISKLIYRLMDISEFRDEVERVYQEKMAGHKSEVLAQIKRRANEIYAAALADSAKWERGDFDEAVDYLYDWVARRYDHFDLVYGDGNTEKVMQEL